MFIERLIKGNPLFLFLFILFFFYKILWRFGGSDCMYGIDIFDIRLKNDISQI